VDDSQDDSEDPNASNGTIDAKGLAAMQQKQEQAQAQADYEAAMARYKKIMYWSLGVSAAVAIYWFFIRKK
jgi:hypothetical protein